VGNQVADSGFLTEKRKQVKAGRNLFVKRGSKSSLGSSNSGQSSCGTKQGGPVNLKLEGWHSKKKLKQAKRKKKKARRRERQNVRTYDMLRISIIRKRILEKIRSER